MEEEKIIYDSLVIFPDGLVLDKQLGLTDLPSGSITIDGHRYRVVEAHISCVSKWKFVLTVA